MPDYRRQMGGARWTPRKLGSGAKDFDASIAANVSIATGVSSFRDDIAGTALTQAAGAAQPPYVAGGLNGRNTIRFNGTSHFLAGAALSNFISAGAHTVWLVARLISASIGSGPAICSRNQVYGDVGQFFLQAFDSTAQTGVYQYDGADKSIISACSLGAWHRFARKQDSGTLSFAIDGAAASTVASGNVFSLTSNFQLAKTGTIFGNVEIAQMIILNRASTAAEDAAAAAYLRGRWGVS